jgi:hypothetical protein
VFRISINKFFENGYAKIVVGVALLNVLLDIWLIPDFGAMGVVWTTIATEGILCLGLGWMLLGKWKEGRFAYRR